MDQSNIKTTSISGLLIVERQTFADDRGFFREVFHMDELEEAIGFKFEIKQMNHAFSHPNVLRALHAENWNKLVYPVSGTMFAAIADIRPDSPTFGKYEAFTFTPDDRKALFIPNGLANSICVNGDEDVHYIYLVDAYYDGKDTKAITWNDPDINVDWPIKNPTVSERDKNNPTLREMFPEKFK